MIGETPLDALDTDTRAERVALDNRLRRSPGAHLLTYFPPERTVEVARATDGEPVYGTVVRLVSVDYAELARPTGGTFRVRIAHRDYLVPASRMTLLRKYALLRTDGAPAAGITTLEASVDPDNSLWQRVTHWNLADWTDKRFPGLPYNQHHATELLASLGYAVNSGWRPSQHQGLIWCSIVYRNEDQL